MTEQECTHLADHLVLNYHVHPSRIRYIADEDDFIMNSDTAKPVGVCIMGPLGIPWAVWYEADKTNDGVLTEQVFEKMDGKMRGGFRK